jgi:hypothetical protein
MATKYVSPSGNDTTGDGSYSNPWEHIYKAIDETTSGDTILLFDGTYAEEVPRSFDKSLRIQSVSSDYTKITIELNSIINRLWRLNGTGKTLELYDLYIANNGSGCWIYESQTTGNTLKVVRCFVRDSDGSLWGCFFVNNTNAYIYKSTFRGISTGWGGTVIESTTTGNTVNTKDCIFENCWRGFYYYNDPFASGQLGNYNSFYNVTYSFEYSSSYGANDITINPKFVNSTEATLQNDSPCIDAGVVVPGYVETYSGTAPDMGVFEYGETGEIGISIINLVSSGLTTKNHVRTGISIINLVSSELHKIVEKIAGESIINLASSEVHRIVEKITGISIIELISSSIYYRVQKILSTYGIYSDIRFMTNNPTYFSVGSDIRLSGFIKMGISSDIRFNVSAYNQLEPKKITDFIIKLDGTTLTDVELETANIDFNLGVTPSEVRMTLVRRHDNYDYTLDGIYSQISDENKIQIYDNTKLLFTGYITTINADSQRDVVDVVVQDIRYKLNKLSLEYTITPRTVIEVQDIIGSYVKPSLPELSPTPVSTNELYYGYYTAEGKKDIVYQGFNVFQNNKSILKHILDNLVSEGLINDYESTILNYVDVQLEGKNLANSYAEMIETLIKECVTMDWYIDENEILRYIIRNSGDIKTLNLASLDKRRHIYDVIIDDIVLNKEKSTYTKGLLIKFGKHHYSEYWIRGLNPDFFPLYYITAKTGDKTYFSFQRFDNDGIKYVGERATNYGYYGAGGAIIEPLYIFQIQMKEEYDYIQDVIIGDPTSIKIIQMDTYGKQTASAYYEEKTDEEATYLYLVQPENYDFIDYAIDVAKLELNQNNKLNTSATVTLLLDAYEYYNISFKNLINLDNTIEEGIYKDNNEFPLNISKISLSLGNRTITLSLSNYGGSFYKRTVNYGNAYSKIYNERKMYKRVPAIIFGQGL